ncbi:hypothetical protein TWF481_012025 [Arthrobotrys musiformis]|uniref:Uncharacterized protein n=1 Tax=Arthrobotrys musiformis TaxID=47236 RepID=A0AAV9VY89_9PEZI
MGRARPCAIALVILLTFQKAHMSPLPPEVDREAASANMTLFHPFGNYSSISVSTPAVLNTTFPRYAAPNNGSHLTAIASPIGDKNCINCENNSIDSTDLELSEEEAASQDKSSPGPNPVKKDVDPTFFYKRNKLIIRCAPPKTVFNISPHDNDLGFPFDRWPRWKKEYVDKSRALVDIEVAQAYCRGSCDCDEGGKITAHQRWKNGHGCSSQWQADRCILVYACYCTAELVQAVVKGNPASIEEYQAALNRIPQTVRNDNPGYFWRMGGLGRRPWDTMTWERSEMDRMLTERPPEAIMANTGFGFRLGREIGPEPAPVPVAIYRHRSELHATPDGFIHEDVGPPLSGPEPPLDPANPYPEGLRYGSPNPYQAAGGRYYTSWLDKRKVPDSHLQDSDPEDS